MSSFSSTFASSIRADARSIDATCVVAEVQLSPSFDSANWPSTTPTKASSCQAASLTSEVSSVTGASDAALVVVLVDKRVVVVEILGSTVADIGGSDPCVHAAMPALSSVAPHSHLKRDFAISSSRQKLQPFQEVPLEKETMDGLYIVRQTKKRQGLSATPRRAADRARCRARDCWPRVRVAA